MPDLPSTTRVTITGADDNVDIRDMLYLSILFPFVEWGILFSNASDRIGTPRYPTEAWIKSLERIADKEWVKLSAHVCGSLSRSIVSGMGDMGWYDKWGKMFGRMQINGWPKPGERGAESSFHYARHLRLNANTHKLRYILQAREASDLPLVAAEAYGWADVLYDPSGGRGVDAGVWPQGPTVTRCGYAGGIGPHNIDSVLDSLPEGWAWIDMESGVRDEQNRLDLRKVRTVLEAVERKIK